MTNQQTTGVTGSAARKILLVLALAALFGAALAALSRAAVPAAEALAPTTGTVTVDGTSTLHDWSVRATTLRGSLDLPAGFLAGETSAVPAAPFTLPVRSSRPVAIDVTATRLAPNRFRLRGGLPLRMTDFGIQPPVALLGLIRARDELWVSIDLEVVLPAEAGRTGGAR